MRLTSRQLVPFKGFLSCPNCGYGFHTFQDRMRRLPVWNIPGVCPRCATKVTYPKWVRRFTFIWPIYFMVTMASFFLGMSSEFLSSLFVVMISGLIPMAALTFIAFAWGMKLKEWSE
jgi:hypothetical protein